MIQERQLKRPRKKKRRVKPKDSKKMIQRPIKEPFQMQVLVKIRK